MLNSPKAQLYSALEKHILEAVQEIRYVAIDIGQLDYYEVRPAVSFPCVLIKFPNANFSDLSQNVQWADIAIGMRLGFSPFTGINSLVPDINKESALQFYEIEDKLYQALQGWTPTIEVDEEDIEICQPLTRLNSNEEQREDPFLVMAMTFATAGEDSGAQTNPGTRTAALELERELIE